MSSVLALCGGLLAVLASARLFTNGLEWFGRRSGMAHAALGSVFAALGTALPEASIAVLAAVGLGRASTGDAVSIGAILGAPLLLATLGFALLGAGALRRDGRALQVDGFGLQRDLVFFLLTFGTATACGLVGAGRLLRAVVGLVLVAAYVLFVVRVLARAGDEDAAAADPAPLLFARSPGSSWRAIAIQLAAAVAVMLSGAELFVHTLSGLAVRLGVSGFVLSALVAPLATELPETVNSVVWTSQGKDTLAVANVTGAMVLQGAVIPAIGMWFTPWRFSTTEGVAALLALAAAAGILVAFRATRRLQPWVLVAAGGLYALFAFWVF